MILDKFLPSLYIEMESRIKDEITFRTVSRGKKKRVLPLCLPDLRLTKINEINKFKYKKLVEKYGHGWKVQVLVNGNLTGLDLKPIHLLCFSKIVFQYEMFDENKFFSVRVLNEVPSCRWAQFRFARRNDIYKMHEIENGLQLIGKVQLKKEGNRRGGLAGSSHPANHLDDATNVPLLEEINVVPDHVDVANRNGQSDGKSLVYTRPSSNGGLKVANISDIDIQQETTQWKDAIVGHIVVKDTENHDVERIVREQWREFEPFNTYELNPGFFLFNFEHETDKTKVLEHTQWFINKRPFILRKWVPNILHNPSSFLTTIPVWVIFPNLDLQFWSLKSLGDISSLIGEPLFMDEPTRKKEILKYARVCVEIKLGGELLDMISIKYDNGAMVEQCVKYEWTLQPCGSCFSPYHDSSACIDLRSNVGPSLLDRGDSIELLSEAEIGIGDNTDMIDYHLPGDTEIEINHDGDMISDQLSSSTVIESANSWEVDTEIETDHEWNMISNQLSTSTVYESANSLEEETVPSTVEQIVTPWTIISLICQTLAYLVPCSLKRLSILRIFSQSPLGLVDGWKRMKMTPQQLPL